MNLYTELIEKNFNTKKDLTAILDPENSFTYQDLNKITSSLCWSFKEIGLNKNDKIILFLKNNIYFVFSYLSIIRSAMTVVPINWMYREHEFAYVLEQIKPKAIITSKDSIRMIQNSFNYVSEYVNDKSPLPIIILTENRENQFLTLKELIKKNYHKENYPTDDIDSDTVSTIAFTNAEDSYYKGAMLTHKNIFTNVEVTGRYLRLDTNDKVLAVLPLFHCFGATTSLFSPLFYGSTVFINQKFNPIDTCRIIENQKITIFPAVPTMYALILGYKDAKNHNLKSVRIWISGGAKMPPPIQIKFEKLINYHIREGYGLTEASPCASFNPLDKPRKIGSIGEILDVFQARIVDSNDKVLPRYKEGELILKGPCVMKGYLNFKEATEKVLKNGWLHTGDVGYMDEDNYVFLTGRLRKMFIVGGFNIYPEELKKLFLLHPEIIDVTFESKPDLVYGEIIKAKVYVKKDSNLDINKIYKFCRKNIAIYKIPKEIEIIKT